MGELKKLQTPMTIDEQAENLKSICLMLILEKIKRVIYNRNYKNLKLLN